MADDEKMPGQGPRHSPLRIWAVLVPALAAIVCVLVLQQRKDEKTTPDTGEQKEPAKKKTSSTPGIFLINKDYDRIKSRVLIRRVVVPTLARLDFAAYDSNDLCSDPEECKPVPPAEKVSLAALDFNGALEKKSLCNHIKETPLTDEEKNSPMAWEPMGNYLGLWDFEAVISLLEAGASISAEIWNDEDVIPAYQQVTRAYLHKTAAGHEMWVKVEFKPWVKFLKDVDDEDADGFPEIYGRIRQDVVSDKLVEELLTNYMVKVLDHDAVDVWGHMLWNDWYNRYGTEDVEEIEKWPDEETLADAGEELAALPKETPIVVLPSELFEKKTYFVLYVEGMAGE